jgi:hypothetical protein
MSPAGWWAVALLASTVGVLLLALWPAIAEAWAPTDTRALEVVRTQDVDVRHFARTFSRVAAEILAAHPGVAATPGAVEVGRWRDGFALRVLGPGAGPRVAVPDPDPRVDEILVAAADLELPGHRVYEHEVYAGGRLEVGSDAACRALYAGAGLRFGTGSVCARWLHAVGTLEAGEGAELYGRASSDRELRLARGCRFERLYAPRVRVVPEALAEALRGALRGPRQRWEVPSGSVRLSEECLLLPRSGWIGDDREVDGDVVARGELQVGSGSLCRGSLKAHRHLELEADCIVRGALVSRRDLTIGPRCRVRGPVIAEGEVRIGAGCVIGSPGHPTTIAARRVILAPGIEIAGTLRAYDLGRVEDV